MGSWPSRFALNAANRAAVLDCAFPSPSASFASPALSSGPVPPVPVLPVPGPVPSSPANNNYEPGFASALMLKDLRLYQEAANMTSSSTPLGANATSIYEQIETLGHDGIDFSGVIKLLQNKLK